MQMTSILTIRFLNTLPSYLFYKVPGCFESSEVTKNKKNCLPTFLDKNHIPG